MKLKILVVDDDEIVVLIHTTLIKMSELKLHPLTFYNTKDVIDYFRKNSNSAEKYLIFLDINMPEINGWNFLNNTTIQNMTGQIFVVIVTSSINKIDKEKAMTYSNVIAFIEKPIKKEDCDNIKLIPEIAKFFQE